MNPSPVFEGIQATTDFVELVAKLVDRLGGVVEVVASSPWDELGRRLLITASPAGEVTPLVIGPLADVIAHVVRAEREFGFVTPVALRSRPWQRARPWRDDATLELWRRGWSPVAVDRLIVPTVDARVEFVIGNARPTPTVAMADSSALDDLD